MLPEQEGGCEGEMLYVPLHLICCDCSACLQMNPDGNLSRTMNRRGVNALLTADSVIRKSCVI
ncbi:MAG: hypothetical protein ACLTZT_18575 [Butyricimonas faecalis]